MRRNLIVLTVVLAAAAGCAKKTVETPAVSNPLIAVFQTPFGVPPFGEIKPEHFMPAFEQGIADQKKEVEAIVRNSQAPTFANTIEVLERSGALLKKVEAVFSNLNSSNTNDQFSRSPKMSHQNWPSTQTTSPLTQGFSPGSRASMRAATDSR